MEVLASPDGVGGVAMRFTLTERVGHKKSLPLLPVPDLVEVIGGWFTSFIVSVWGRA